MHRKILVPLDGSDYAEAALSLALSVASRTDGELHLVTVVPTLPAVTPAAEDTGPVKGWFEEERVRATRYLEGMKERIAELDSGRTVHTRVVSGQAVSALEDRIRKTDIDLVVMTTHGKGPLERMWIGSVADGLIRSAPCPVLLWRPEDENPDPTARPEIERILVPLDGSTASESILPQVRAVGRAFDASISLLSVFVRRLPLGSTYIPHAAEEEEEREAIVQELRRHLDTVAEGLRADGFEVDAEVVMSEGVASRILEHREALGADLIAMSTQGRGGVARLVVGSVADKVIRAARTPVLVHRHDTG